MLQASLRTQAASVTSVSAILSNTNALLYRSTALHQFATFFLARIDGESLQMTFCNAGHNWPVVMRPGGGREFLERGGTILGILEQLALEEGSVSLAPGDIVVLYTDGISEAADPSGEQYGETRLCECVAALPPGVGAKEIAECVLVDLRAFLGGTEAQDDITLLVLRVPERVSAMGAAEPRVEVVGAR
jgi:sigma-B regulation protein RsbU (phosphoserine phosphatase)